MRIEALTRPSGTLSHSFATGEENNFESGGYFFTPFTVIITSMRRGRKRSP